MVRRVDRKAAAAAARQAGGACDLPQPARQTLAVPALVDKHVKDVAVVADRNKARDLAAVDRHVVDVAGSDVAAHARFVVLAQEGAGAFAARFVDNELEGAGAQQARTGGQVGGVEGANQHVESTCHAGLC
jgi:hypothetical protein